MRNKADDGEVWWCGECVHENAGAGRWCGIYMYTQSRLRM